MGHRAVPVEVDETIEVRLPERCPDCGDEVEIVETVDQYQEELPEPKPQVRRFLLEVGRCRGCRRRLQARHPEQTSDAIGTALTTLLHHQLGLSAGKTARVLGDSLGLQLSRGGVVQQSVRVGARLEPTYQALVEGIRSSELVSSDETGWRIGCTPGWLWVHANRDLAVFSIEAGRDGRSCSLLAGR